MHITKLTIERYKNIDNLNMNLTNSFTPLIIGKNGSGKSNFLEALLIVFKTLYTFNLEECSFDFSISIKARNQSEITIKKIKNEIIIHDENRSIPKQIFKDKYRYIDTVFQYRYLPENIIVYYLGDNKRLYSIAKSIARSNKNVDTKKYNYSYNSIILIENEMQLSALVAIYLTGANLSLNFSMVEVILNIQHSQAELIANSVLNQFIINSEALKSGRNVITLRPNNETNISLIELTNGLNELIKSNVLSKFVESDRYGINIMIDHNYPNNKSHSINFRELSEGEQNKAIISSFAYVFDGKTDNSIFLMDEPDAFFNPSWQNQLVSSLKELTKNQVFISSHSSNIISRSNNNEIYYFKEGRVVKLDAFAYGRDVRFIQQFIQDIPRFPNDVQILIDTFFDSISKDELEGANRTLNKIENIFGSNDPYFTELKTILGFVEADRQ